MSVQCYVKLKRKTFWVVRWIEIIEGILTYREKQGDRVKGEYQLINCKISEVIFEGQPYIDILAKGEKLKIMAHTQKQHNDIVKVIRALKQPIEHKEELQIREAVFTPDLELLRPPDDSVRMTVSQKLREFKAPLTDVTDGIWVYTQQEKIGPEKKVDKFSRVTAEIEQFGVIVCIVLAIIVFLLTTILIYLLLRIVDNTTYFYSVLITINLIAVPLAIRYIRVSKQKQITKTSIIARTSLKADYNGLTFILTRNQLRLKWCPQVLEVSEGKEIVIAYVNQRESFTQSSYQHDQSIIVVDHIQNQIKRFFQIKWISDEEVDVLFYSSDGINYLPFYKAFVKCQYSNPRSEMLEYFQNRSKGDNKSFIERPDKLQLERPQEKKQSEILSQSPMTQSPMTKSIDQSAQNIQLDQDPALKAYYKLADETRAFFNRVQPLSDEWKLQSDKNGFKIHTRIDPASNLTLSRGEGVIPFDKEKIFDIIQDVAKRGDYDGLFETGYPVKQFNPELAIIYQKFKKIMIVKSRDFVMMTRVYREQNSIIAIAKSVEYEAVPPNNNSQRADLKMAGWLLTSLENGHTNACFITMMDPMGNIPGSIVASSAKEQGQCVEKICKLLIQRNK